MIIVNLKGGLGNQMFQYACGRAISIIKNEELLLDVTGYKKSSRGDTPREYRLNFFNIKAGLATKDQIKKSKYPLGIISKGLRFINAKVLKRHYIGYHPELLVKKAPGYIDGFFNSNLYFENIRDTILSDFSIRRESLSSETSALEKDIASAENSVALHVRRGDYVQDQNTAAAHNTIGIDYYKECISKIKGSLKSPHFFIFSDDIEWVKGNIEIEDKITYVSRQTLRDYEELHLMSLCKNFIIANSTFSWWGAWLSTHKVKIVIAPKKWNNKYQDKYKDLLPPEWIKI